LLSSKDFADKKTIETETGCYPEENGMADKFCIYCGKPLVGAKRFCSSCGKAVGADPETKGESSALDGNLFERLAGKVRMPDAGRLFSKPEPLLQPEPRLASPRVSSPAPQARATSTQDSHRISFDRVSEPNENAFTVLAPKGWQIRGGIFNVNPVQANGPGNSISPKCDFAVVSDDQGTMMIRWMASWNFADLTYSPTGGAFFPPGQWYKGMPVRLMTSPRQFLLEMLQGERQGASGMTIAMEDPLQEVTAAFYKQAEEVNQNLQRMGLYPLNFDSCAMRVEYSEGGRRYSEEVTVTICDNRPGAFMWTNENTVLMRAPAAEYATWGPVFLQIRNSLETNPQWLAAVQRASGERAKLAWLTQQYINKVCAEEVARRQAAYEQAQREREQEAARQEAEERARERRGG
jgi:hypothetical protein